MRIVFMGTPAFAVPALTALAACYDVIGVYTRPDKPSGRGRALKPSPVKVAALASGLPVFQPASLRTPETLEELRALEPHCIVVAAYGAILPPDVLDVPKCGCVNVHGSILPRWRGAAPIQRAILAGDAETGVSIMQMEAGLDTGPWCLQGKVGVDHKYAAELTDELASLGADLLMEALPSVEAGAVVWVAQDEAEATYASKLSAADVALSPDLTVADALRRVRASGPSAPCRVTVGGRSLTVTRAVRTDETLSLGIAACTTALVLGCADGAVELTHVIPEGKAAMASSDFLRGARLAPTCEWTSR
jgi:methionyl-tRNA formyltransferase